MYDFDVMMQRKKEESYRRRKRKNFDIINDSDDVIADLISQMKQAADVSVLPLIDVMWVTRIRCLALCRRTSS